MSQPHLKLVENERAFRRVNACLDGALCMPGKPIALFKTRNISQGGIAIDYSGKRRPKPGTNVKVQLNGILSSGPEHKLDIYNMTVVHTEPGKVGLAFAQEL